MSVTLRCRDGSMTARMRAAGWFLRKAGRVRTVADYVCARIPRHP